MNTYTIIKKTKTIIKSVSDGVKKKKKKMKGKK